MANDIVERLRAFAAGCRGSMWQSRNTTIELMDEAADEITQLRKRLEMDSGHPYDGITARDETIRGQDAIITAQQARITRLEEGLAGMSALVEHMQAIAGAHLPPDGMSKDDALNMLIDLLDGPDQREAQGKARAALQETTDGR